MPFVYLILQYNTLNIFAIPRCKQITGNANPTSSYITISPNQYCGTKSGHYVARCLPSSSKTSNECETLCSNLNWCVAYSHWSLRDTCHLVTSTGSCPIGYTGFSGTTVTSSDQLAAHPNSPTNTGWSCYGKPTGNN